jgi:type IV pilus assembly protein PilB
MKKKRLGEVLRERGQISPADLAKAIEEQQGKVIHLGELMLERRMVNKPDLAAALAEVTHVPYVDCATVHVDPAAVKRIPLHVAQRFIVLPTVQEGTRLVVVMAEPQNLHTIDELRFTAGLTISPRLGFRNEILTAIEKHYGIQNPPEATIEKSYGSHKPAEATIERSYGLYKPAGASGAATASAAPATPAAQVEESPAEVEEQLAGMEFFSTSSRQSNQEAMQEIQAELAHKRTPAVRLVSSIIAAALERHASDVHIEPQATDTAVRIRVDGVLRDLQRAPRNLQNSLISRIKILSDMDIAERRTPQDGRFMVRLGSKKLDMRVSTLPTQYGEKVVMRLLEPDAPLLGLAELGLAREISEGLTRLLALPQGMLLVTGPTGAGKSTTLYAALNLLRKPSVNIVTVEDPVEYNLEGINQVHVNTKAGLNFANVLRSILRQDPNIIMVGEIRDRETAEIAMKASQTGHLVLSTLHTNDSIAAVTRLLDLDIPGFLIASSVTGIMAQRLVRKLCACRDEVPATPEFTTQLLNVGLAEPPKTQAVPVGCPTCGHIGYKGRVGIYELLTFSESIRGAVRSGARTDEIRALARTSGMKLMQEYALDNVRRGLTTIEEVLRVVPFEPAAAVECSSCGRDLLPSFMFCPHCGAKRKRTADQRTAAPNRVPEGALQA